MCCVLQAEAVAAARADASARAAAMQDELQHKLQELQQEAALVRTAGACRALAQQVLCTCGYPSMTAAVC
jgi:hypothetical protein